MQGNHCFSHMFGYWLSSRNIFQGAKSIVMQISFVVQIFLLFLDINFREAKVSEGDKLLQGAPPAPLWRKDRI